jgi:hypothetical protein
VEGRAFDGPEEPDPEERGSVDLDDKVDARNSSAWLNRFDFLRGSLSLFIPSTIFRFAFFFASRGGGSQTL